MSGCRRINMWSGPRNVSTAMMYSWRQRSDTTVWDEPMYGHYLAYTGVVHAVRDEILAKVPADRDEIVELMPDEPDRDLYRKWLGEHTTAVTALVDGTPLLDRGEDIRFG